MPKTITSMRYFRILLLHLEGIFEHRTRSLVWFLISLLNPLLVLLFWRGALSSQHNTIGLTMPVLTSYYFLLIIASSLLEAHIEEDVATTDIRLGGLSKYLIRPFSYYWIKFFQEIPYRILQGFYGIIIFVIFYFLMGKFISLVSDPLLIFGAFVITVTAYFISFTYKMIIGLLAFWVIDIKGLYQTLWVTNIVLAGFVVPLELMPPFLQKVAVLSPFAYVIYFPISAFQGKLNFVAELNIFGIQIVWLLLLTGLYSLLWKKGLQKFSAVGQ